MLGVVVEVERLVEVECRNRDAPVDEVGGPVQNVFGVAAPCDRRS